MYVKSERWANGRGLTVGYLGISAIRWRDRSTVRSLMYHHRLGDVLTGIMIPIPGLKYTLSISWRGRPISGPLSYRGIRKARS